MGFLGVSPDDTGFKRPIRTAVSVATVHFLCRQTAVGCLPPFPYSVLAIKDVASDEDSWAEEVSGRTENNSLQATHDTHHRKGK